MVEQWPFKPTVGGSSPSGCTPKENNCGILEPYLFIKYALRMKLSYIGIAGVAALALAFSLPALAATSFVVTGIVDVKLTKSVVNVTATKVSSSIADEVEIGENLPYSLSKSTKYYKYVNKKLTKTGIGSLRMGQEVVVKGTKVGDTFKVSSLTINDRSFVITGTISSINKDNKEITVGVKTSSYKQANLKGTDVTMTYSSSTKCIESGKEIGCSEIDADGQKMTMQGGVTGTDNKYELTKVINKK